MSLREIAVRVMFNVIPVPIFNPLLAIPPVAEI